MKTIYLSPHLDDAVFSAGGWIWEQTQDGQEVEIWTICAGDPPPGALSSFAAELHQSWNLGKDAVQIRREEDKESCRILGAVPRHFHYLDCIYRSSPDGESLYSNVADIVGGLDPREADLIDLVSRDLKEALPKDAEVIVPLGIGNHVDHELVRKAASRLERDLYYYADYPYARDSEGQEILKFMEGSQEWQGEQMQVSKEGLDRWFQGAIAYVSQISTFWEDGSALENEIKQFSAYLGGFIRWEALDEES
jgi:LmbE family N-acetylglucosaminyl deacetylase